MVSSHRMFYLNSGCNEDISSCNADSLTSFFDFTSPAEANATLNSQGREIETGTYKYVRLEFCKYGATGNVTVLGTYTGASPVTLTYGGCGETSAELSPPLELSSGDSVQIQLSYDLTHTINVTDGTTTTSSNCAVDSGASKVVCLGSLSFNPSVVR
ncbi:MAG: hypothetical protein NDJ89_15495 [Oligoflexia bacterium]|nr:hypothetical protein [Oligoflexia bacterium]